MAGNTSLAGEQLLTRGILRVLASALLPARLLDAGALADGAHPACRASSGCRGAARLRARCRFWPQGLHMCHPRVELCRLLSLNPVRHASMLDPAELGALRGVVALNLSLEPHPAFPVGEHVPLGRKLGHPEAMDNVRTAHPQRDRPAHGNMDLVCCGDVVFRVAKFPPPLMADHFDGERIL